MFKKSFLYRECRNLLVQVMKGDYAEFLENSTEIFLIVC